jgi:hypothetical protein
VEADDFVKAVRAHNRDSFSKENQVNTGMIITVQNQTWELHVTSSASAKARDGVNVEVRHKPSIGERVMPWGGIRFGLSKAEAFQIAHALMEATDVNRDGSLTVAAPNCSQARDPVEPARRKLNAWKLGQEPRFTPTQGKYLAFIQRYFSKYGVAPAYSDIQRHFLVSAPSVNAMMQTLARRGLISRTPGAARSIRLLLPAEELPKL